MIVIVIMSSIKINELFENNQLKYMFVMVNWMKFHTFQNVFDTLLYSLSKKLNAIKRIKYLM